MSGFYQLHQQHYMVTYEEKGRTVLYRIYPNVERAKEVLKTLAGCSDYKGFKIWSAQELAES